MVMKLRNLPSVRNLVKTTRTRLGFGGGVNNTAAEQFTDRDELVDGLNGFVDETGAFYNRLGVQRKGQLIGVTTGILGLFNFTNRAGTQVFIAVNDTKAYYDNSGVWTDLGLTLTTNLTPAGVYYSETDKFYLTNGTDNVGVITTTGSVTTDASFKKGKYIESFDGRIVTANVTNQEDYLWVSDLGADTFGANAYQRAEGAIVGLLALGPRNLLVFTERKIYQVPGLTSTPNAAGPEAFFDLGASYGAIAPRSIVKINGKAYFLGMDSQNVADVYMTDGQNISKVGSPKIKNYLNGLATGQLTKVVATQDGRYYRFAVAPSGASTNTREYLFDTVTGKWQPEFRPGFPINAYATIRVTGEDVVYAGHQSLGQVFRINQGRYDELIDQSYTTGQDADESIAGATTVRASQGFKLSHSVALTRLCISGAVLLKKVSGTTTELTVRIETDNGGKPSGTLANSNATTTITAFSDTSYVWKTFTFSTPFSLTGTTQYHLVIQHTTEGSGNSVYAWGSDSSSPTYSSGATSNYSSSAWTADSTTDNLFALFIEEHIESYAVQVSNLDEPRYPKRVQKVLVQGQSSTGVIAKLGLGVEGKDSEFDETDINLSGKSNVWASSQSDTTSTRLVWATSATEDDDTKKWASGNSLYSLTVLPPVTIPEARYYAFRFYFKGIGEFRIDNYVPIYEVIPTDF